MLTWSSVNGAPFGAATRIRGAYTAMTGPQDVLNAGGSTLIGTVNPGLGFSSFGAARGAFEFLDAGPDVKDSSLALDRLGHPVQAYFELGESPNAGDSKVRVLPRHGRRQPRRPRQLERADGRRRPATSRCSAAALPASSWSTSTRPRAPTGRRC